MVTFPCIRGDFLLMLICPVIPLVKCVWRKGKVEVAHRIGMVMIVRLMLM